MSALRQAVIFCGGPDMRLRADPDPLPKPMIPVNGRPFLQYLIEQQRDQSLTNIVLLTGYRGSQIEEYFGDGRRFGVNISYSHGPPEWETGRRIFEARSQLEPRFLLLDSENFVVFSLEKLQSFHAGHRRPLSLMLSATAAGNIQVGSDGIVKRYDASRSSDNLNHVEIGYMIVERDDILPLIAPVDISFSAILLRLAERSALAGMVCGDRYYSISDRERCKLTEQYLRIKRILLIDRDGTLNRRPQPPARYLTRWQDFHWAAGALEGMKALATAGFAFILISNQAGIARGIVSAADVDAINSCLSAELASRGVRMLTAYVCPHWETGCSCRKPAPGLLFEASRDHLLRLDRTFFIGDEQRDCQAAYNANCPGVFIGSEDELVSLRVSERPAHVARTLIEAAPWIIERFIKWETGQW